MQEILNPIGMEARRQKAAILYFKLMGMWMGDIDYCIRVRRNTTMTTTRVEALAWSALDASWVSLGLGLRLGQG